MQALDTKLLRDLWHMRGQALAIAFVIASGVATFVMCVATLASLRLTRETFYSDHRFAELFVMLQRAPEGVAARLADLPGVERVETRVVSPVNLDLSDYDQPVTGQIVSLPDDGQALLNGVHLRRGRLIAPGREDEVLLSDAFAAAHRLTPGAELYAVVRGHRRRLRVVGIALSPDYIFQQGPGTIFPDFERYGILWMGRSPLGVACEMEGAFNAASLTLAPDANLQDVIERVDDLLRPYGGQGAYGRADQLSHRYLNEEFKQLEMMARLFPTIFLGVAAFLLNVVVGRLVNTQREQIATLKAFGYTDLEVGLHYLKLVLCIVTVGVLGGVALGAWMGQGLTEMYMTYYRFPAMRFEIPVWVAAAGAGISLAAAGLGTLLGVRRAAKLPPAQAMRPEPPAAYRVSLVERLGLGRLLGQPTRMIVRNLERRPAKTALSTLGIGMACAILMVSSFFWDSIERVIFVQFRLVQREDLTVSFTEPTSYRARYELRALPGVRHVEVFRSVSVRFRAGHRSYRTGIVGLEPDGGQLHRLLDADLRPIRVPEDGLLLTDHLGTLLGVGPGDEVTVEVLEGARPVRRLRVVRLVKEYLGVTGYMGLGALNRLLDEGPAISGAYLALEPGCREDRLYAALDERPRVAGTLSTRGALANFQQTMAQQMLTFALFNTILASSIAFGVIYNAARIALGERGRELASLRVLGFTRGEISYILLGELTAMILVAIPLGWVAGVGLCAYMVQTWQIDLFRLPFALTSRTFAFAAAVVSLSGVVSLGIIRRRLSRLDLVAVLKTKE